MGGRHSAHLRLGGRSALREYAKAVETLADHLHVEITDATRDLIAVQTEGSLVTVDLLLAQAADEATALADFAAVERAYTNSIFGGRIARYLRDRVVLAAAAQGLRSE